MSIIFPKPLPRLSKETQADQTGFTEIEKVALRNAWRVIKRQIRKHSREIFLDLYTEREELVGYFRTPNGAINMHALHKHPGAVLDFFNRLIEDGLDNEGLFHVILSDAGTRHSKFLTRAAQPVIEKQTKSVEIYLTHILRYSFSPTLKEALAKLSNIIETHIMHELSTAESE